MKSRFLYLAAAAAVLASGACTQKQTTVTTDTNTDSGSDKVYTGVLPAADAEGVRYTVLLDYDDVDNTGDYEMVQTYFMTDSTGTVNDLASYVSEGDFTVNSNANGQKYLKFSGDGDGEMFFLVDSDSTITMTDANLTPSETPGLNYTLKAAK